MAILRRPGRQRLLIVADAVFIKERLIHQILVNQHPGDTGDQRGVRAGANGDPLIFATGGGIGVARIDNDHPRVGALAGLFQIPGNAAAAHAGFRRVVAEHHHQLTVFNIRGAVAVVTAVGVGHGAGDLRGAVGTVLVKRAAVAVHQPRHRRSGRRGASDVPADNS